MLLTPQRDPGKSWFSLRDQVLGALSHVRDAGLGFPQM